MIKLESCTRYFNTLLFSRRCLAIIALLLLLASILIKWFDVPLGNSIKSYHLSLFSNRLYLNPNFIIFSFGNLTIILLLISCITIIKNKSYLYFITGVLSLFLCLLIFCKLIFYNLSFLEDFCDQNNQVIRMLAFSKFLPQTPNRLIDPTLAKEVSSYDLTDRLYTSWHYITWGWYFLFIAAIIFIFLGFRFQKNKIVISVILCSFFLLFIAIITRPTIAEYYKYRGDAFLANNQYNHALKSYDNAISFNKQLESNYKFMLHYSQIYYYLGKKQSFYYLFYKGVKLAQNDQLDEAIETLSEAYKQAPTNSITQRTLSKFFLDKAINYFSKNILDTALTSWQKSLLVNPNQIENYYYLSHGYIKYGQYLKAIQAGQLFINFSKNSSLVANTYANMGDAAYWLKNYSLARFYYEKSRNFDLFLNYRAGQALGGT